MRLADMNMNSSTKKSKVFMMFVASVIGGVVVGLVTVICFLVVNRGQSSTEDMQSEAMATSGTTTRITTWSGTEGKDSETTDRVLETTKSPEFTILPVFRVRVIQYEPKASLRFALIRICTVRY